MSQESLVCKVFLCKNIKVTTSYGNLSAIAILRRRGKDVGKVYEFTNELLKWVNLRWGSGWSKWHLGLTRVLLDN